MTAEPMTAAQRWAAVMKDNYGTPPIALVRGSGIWVTDDQERRYMDLLGGIAVNALGHAHPAIVEAVSEQIARLGHTSNLAITEPAAAAGRAAGRAGGPPRWRPRLPVQLRRRGQRGRLQACPAHRPDPDGRCCRTGSTAGRWVRWR